MKQRVSNSAGFTLIEIAVVMLIIALAIGGSLSVFSTQMEVQKIKETQSALDEAKEALLGYAMTHLATDSRPYFPCPDRQAGGAPATRNDGVEDRTGSSCAVSDGNLPWVTLGLKGADGWSNRLRYQVTANFANSTNGLKLDTAGAITINNAQGTAIATAIPLVILSHGPNGLGAISSGGAAVGAPTRANELENADGDTTFVSNGPIEIAGSEFDDVVIWLPSGVLFNRMLQAGVCVKTTACP